MHDDTLGALRALLKEHSVQFGDFVLASGQRSNVYVDARLTTLKAAAMPLIGRAFLDAMERRGWRPDAVGGLTMGADPIVSAVSRESLERGLELDGFLIRKEAKGHGRGQYVEGLPSGEGLTAVIVEDTCTTGGSTIKAIERAREFGFEVLAAITLVDREQGGREAVEATGCGFEAILTMAELIEKDSR
jgi:orotate phosphoribosyltransferase